MDIRRQTQTDTTQGNCWQTAIACVLAVKADQLPDQAAIEGGPEPKRYHNVLCYYLLKHHGLMYSELADYQIGALMIRAPGWHVLTGPTVRTQHNQRNHCVVGRYGQTIWDPHPSRAGLLSKADAAALIVDGKPWNGQIKWGILSPATPRLIETWRRMGSDPHERCICPSCARAS